MDKDKNQKQNTPPSQSPTNTSPPGQSMQTQPQNKLDSQPQTNQSFSKQNQQSPSVGSQPSSSSSNTQQSAPNMGTPQQDQKQSQPPKSSQSSMPESTPSFSTPNMPSSSQHTASSESRTTQKKQSQSIPPQGTSSAQTHQQPQTTGNQSVSEQKPDSQTQQPSAQQPSQPSDGETQGSSVVISGSESGPSRFTIIIAILAVIAILIYAGVAYIYFQNKQLEEGLSSGGSQQNTQQIQQAIATPTPSFSADQIQIESGNIIRTIPNGETEILINKANYDATGISGFTNVNVSPNNRFMCFESWPPAPEPAMYLSNIDGTNVVEVNPNRRGCRWMQNSQNIVYTNQLRETSPVDIFIYDVSTNQETNLTADTHTEAETRQYSIVSITEADQTVQCSYSVVNSAGDLVSEDNECVINITTGQMTDSGSQIT